MKNNGKTKELSCNSRRGTNPGKSLRPSKTLEAGQEELKLAYKILPLPIEIKEAVASKTKQSLDEKFN